MRAFTFSRPLKFLLVGLSVFFLPAPLASAQPAPACAQQESEYQAAQMRWTQPIDIDLVDVNDGRRADNQRTKRPRSCQEIFDQLISRQRVGNISFERFLATSGSRGTNINCLNPSTTLDETQTLEMFERRICQCRDFEVRRAQATAARAQCTSRSVTVNAGGTRDQELAVEALMRRGAAGLVPGAARAASADERVAVSPSAPLPGSRNVEITPSNAAAVTLPVQATSAPARPSAQEVREARAEARRTAAPLDVFERTQVGAGVAEMARQAQRDARAAVLASRRDALSASRSRPSNVASSSRSATPGSRVAIPPVAPVRVAAAPSPAPRVPQAPLLAQVPPTIPVTSPAVPVRRNPPVAQVQAGELTVVRRNSQPNVSAAAATIGRPAPSRANVQLGGALVARRVDPSAARPVAAPVVRGSGPSHGDAPAVLVDALPPVQRDPAAPTPPAPRAQTRAQVSANASANTASALTPSPAPVTSQVRPPVAPRVAPDSRITSPAGLSQSNVSADHADTVGTANAPSARAPARGHLAAVSPARHTSQQPRVARPTRTRPARRERVPAPVPVRAPDPQELLEACVNSAKVYGLIAGANVATYTDASGRPHFDVQAESIRLMGPSGASRTRQFAQLAQVPNSDYARSQPSCQARVNNIGSGGEPCLRRIVARYIGAVRDLEGLLRRDTTGFSADENRARAEALSRASSEVRNAARYLYTEVLAGPWPTVNSRFDAAASEEAKGYVRDVLSLIASNTTRLDNVRNSCEQARSAFAIRAEQQAPDAPAPPAGRGAGDGASLRRPASSPSSRVAPWRERSSNVSDFSDEVVS